MADVYLIGVLDEPAILSGTLRRNRSGNWTLIAERIASEQQITGQVSLRWLDRDLRGHVVTSEISEGYCVATIRGGTGGLVRSLAPKMYDFQVSAALIASNIASECGERLAPASNAALATPLASWIRRRGTAEQQLTALCDAIDAVWRVELDGSILVTRDTYAPIVGWDHTIPQGGWHARYAALNVISTELAAAPGQSYSSDLPGLTGKKIASVCYCTGDGPECWLYFVPDAAPATAGEAEPLREFIRETMRETAYHVTLSGRAAVQRADGSVDVYPDDRRLPALTTCLVRPPVPGGRVTVSPGTQVVVLFENADPRQRVIVAYGQGSPTYPVALVNDGINAGTITITPALVASPPSPPSGTITLSYTDGKGNALLPPLVITVAAGLITDVAPPAPTIWPLLGPITGPGSTVLKSS